jgi:hypothetical protein
VAKYFDQSSWENIISQPDWYIQLYPELQSLRERWENEPDDIANPMKRAVRNFFKDAYETDQLALASKGKDMDTDRKPIDTIVLHHTSGKPGYDIGYMNATQLLNIYVPYLNDPESEYADMKGKPLWSGHVRNGKPVFYGYHWLMRMDGSFERLLGDNELGWHAANWDINCRSVAICLDNDYKQQDPEPQVIERLGQFIAEKYPAVPKDRIVGHGEVAAKPTLCPGTNFQSQWKAQVLAAV